MGQNVWGESVTIRFIHLASLEQQCELMRYMNSLNEWLSHDVEDHQAKILWYWACSLS
jgi:hypothetical protein